MTIYRQPNLLFPSGWFLIGLSNEFPKGKVKPIKVFDRELVGFRTLSGTIAFLDAYCPHLGAHLGHGGCIVGETIRCPFHGLCFNTNGQCVKTYSKNSSSEKLLIKKWSVYENAGLIFIWYDQDESSNPLWEIPHFNPEGCSPYLAYSSIVPAHPLDTNENSVDIRHFFDVHNVSDLEILEQAKMENHIFHSRYRLNRQGIRFLKQNFIADVDIYLYGLGYTVVNMYLAKYQIKTRLMTFYTCIDKEQTKMTIIFTITEMNIQNAQVWLKIFPKKLINYFLSRILFLISISEVKNDIKIWKNKKYLTCPKLMVEDASIAKYRQWTKQFFKN